MYTKKALRKQNFSTPTDQVVLVLVKVILIGKISQISQHVFRRAFSEYTIWTKQKHK